MKHWITLFTNTELHNCEVKKSQPVRYRRSGTVRKQIRHWTVFFEARQISRIERIQKYNKCNQVKVSVCYEIGRRQSWFSRNHIHSFTRRRAKKNQKAPIFSHFLNQTAPSWRTYSHTLFFYRPIIGLLLLHKYDITKCQIWYNKNENFSPVENYTIYIRKTKISPQAIFVTQHKQYENVFSLFFMFRFCLTNRYDLQNKLHSAVKRNRFSGCWNSIGNWSVLGQADQL